MHQLRCGVGDLRSTLRQAEVDDKVLAFNKAEFAQSLSKAIDESRWWRSNTQEADVPELPLLLC